MKKLKSPKEEDEMNYTLAGIPMKNYLVASSSPLTESVERLLCCKEAHFSAAILKSCADYEKTGNGYGRKVVYVKDGYYADASFENEILTLNEGIDLFHNAQDLIKDDMLLIPSVSALSLEANEWINSCRKFKKLGAKMIQLDFFYLGTLKQNDEFYQSLKILLSTLKKNLDCVLMPKLNLKFEPNRICKILKDSGISYVSLLDSMRENPDEKYNLHQDNTSYFGPRQLPFTLEYLKAAKKQGLFVCAGGGITKREDIDVLIKNGADMIQVASYILNRDYSFTKNLLPDTAEYDFYNPILKHNPWCDSQRSGNCDHCGACAPHILP